MKEMKTNVSVVICIRNVEKYIGNCLRSILDQSFKDYEIIIIDDVSTDNGRKIIEGFDDRRTRYFRNKERLEISNSRNKGAECTTGKYIFFTGGDCIVSKNWIEEGI
jgi:glycosyltransferase involved in cell wall biosynthesis